MLSPCNARLKSLQTFAKFPAYFSVFSSSFFSAQTAANSCFFFTPPATLWPNVKSTREAVGKGGVACRGRVPRPLRNTRLFTLFAPLWCIFVALPWRLNCKTWPFKNAPRLPNKIKEKKMERNGSCKNFANASNFATKNWGKAESRQWSSWQRWKEQRVPGRGSHMQLPHGCKIYENWFSLKRAKPKPKPDNLMPAWEKLWKLHLMTFWLETCQTILIEASGLIPFVFSCSLFIFFCSVDCLRECHARVLQTLDGRWRARWIFSWGKWYRIKKFFLDISNLVLLSLTILLYSKM